LALARLISRGQAGLDAYEVSVEVHLSGGLPGFAITGLPTAAVRESKDRVRAALQNCGFSIPAERITVHLGPADVPKDGGRFDLAIALGVIKAKQERTWDTDTAEFLGELTLSGALRPIDGAVPAALAARAVGRRLIVPEDNAGEVSLVADARGTPRATCSKWSRISTASAHCRASCPSRRPRRQRRVSISATCAVRAPRSARS
jgi:magnesium chelatase family protein